MPKVLRSGWIPRSPFNSQHDLEVANSEDREESEKVQRNDNVTSRNEEGNHNANSVVDTLIAEEDARDKAERKNQNGGALYLIKDVRLGTKGTDGRSSANTNREPKRTRRGRAADWRLVGERKPQR